MHIFYLVKMKLFLVRLSLSPHGCPFHCSIAFVLRAVHLIILKDLNPQKHFWEDFLKLSFTAKLWVQPVTSASSWDVLYKSRNFTGRDRKAH